MTEDKEFEALIAVLDNCAANASSLAEQLDLLQLAWLVRAQAARSEALAIPNGFPVEQARQVSQLEKMAELISADSADLEFERLALQGDVPGMLRHIRKLTDDDEEEDKS